jgi:hypothetical protein
LQDFERAGKSGLKNERVQKNLTGVPHLVGEFQFSQNKNADQNHCPAFDPHFYFWRLRGIVSPNFISKTGNI